jgi:hypothetical protein
VDSHATALRLIDLLYQGLEDRAAFNAFSEQLAIELDANMVALSLRIEDTPAPTSSFGVDSAFVEKFQKYYHTVNMHETVGRQAVHTSGALFSSETFLPERLLKSSEYYNDFLRPQRVLHIFGTVLGFGPSGVSNLAVYPAPNRTANAFKKAEPLIWALVPHLQRVRRMALQNGVAQAAHEALNQFNSAVIVVGPSGKVLLMNSAAERVITFKDGLSCAGGVLRALQPKQDAQLKLAMHSACATDTPVKAFVLGSDQHHADITSQWSGFTGTLLKPSLMRRSSSFRTRTSPPNSTKRLSFRFTA